MKQIRDRRLLTIAVSVAIGMGAIILGAQLLAAQTSETPPLDIVLATREGFDDDPWEDAVDLILVEHVELTLYDNTTVDFGQTEIDARHGVYFDSDSRRVTAANASLPEFPWVSAARILSDIPGMARETIVLMQERAGVTFYARAGAEPLEIHFLALPEVLRIEVWIPCEIVIDGQSFARGVTAIVTPGEVTTIEITGIAAPEFRGECPRATLRVANEGLWERG